MLFSETQIESSFIYPLIPIGPKDNWMLASQGDLSVSFYYGAAQEM